MGKTSIEWTDHSWPVVNGCRRVSAGCENCYAERLSATRLSQTPKYQGLAVMKPGPEGVRRRDMADGSVRLTKVQGPGRPRWSGEARLWVPHLDLPLKLKKPSRIFVADMGDLFYEGVPDEVIAAVFGVMAACPQHTFQVLTKRPERARAWFRGIGNQGWAERACAAAAAVYLPNGVGQPLDNTWPLRNVWLGVSCEDQATADERIPVLLDTPAAVRFVSAEPLLGGVDLSHWLNIPSPDAFPDDPLAAHFMAEAIQEGRGDCRRGLDWVIVGGESGPGARPFSLAWAGLLVETCREAGVACFVKQLGAKPYSDGLKWVGPFGGAWPIRSDPRKGGDPADWPPELRVRQFPAGTASNPPQKQEAAAGAGRASPGITAG